MYNKGDFEREIEPKVRDSIGIESYRHPARRDYARLIHSPSFRRQQGKTQLFPGLESDFFRNRLTHSLEVSQIAESIAFRLNETETILKNNKSYQIMPEVARVAGLFHDLGHPPFGHNGEKALDECMKSYGGFEGNAQTLRIITCLEKKVIEEPSARLSGGIDKNGRDQRKGLGLTYRVIASALKYDTQIPRFREENENLIKGYYECDKDIVSKVKNKVIPGYNSENDGTFKTIECAIMDLADDIAYSTYDVEDSLKASFISPLTILADLNICIDVAQVINRNTNLNLSGEDVFETLYETFAEVLPELPISTKGTKFKENLTLVCVGSKLFNENGYYRSNFTSDLISGFIAGVTFKFNKKFPPLSKVSFDDNTLRKVEVLKRYIFHTMILSPRLKTIQFRGEQIVKNIFETLSQGSGKELLPMDFRLAYNQFDKANKTEEKKRVICDFIAGMTDSYAIEFYARLNSENPQTIFKPF